MIDLYFWTTPNGYKPLIFLEETGLAHSLRPVDISKGEQFDSDFLEISPNNRIPAIVDRAPADGRAAIAVFESGAILHYLADKTGRFLPHDAGRRADVMQWLFWQMSGLGPMAGQNHHFRNYAPEKIPYAIDRYVRETARLYGVLDKRLGNREFVAREYSIADMAIYPWIVPHARQGQDLDDYPNLKRWFERVHRRPAVIHAYARGRKVNTRPTVTEESRGILFGQTGPRAA